MATIWVVKVHCGGTHQPTTREAQGSCREIGAEGSVEQNLGLDEQKSDTKAL
ncbi:hypothetical protein [Oceanobacillus rekensis]|uniref:hypothetical protein n=1 Tax=Oceanobacillus rekensis TaxID=937927 RepID=UPI0015935C6E|nr:hypothetical protein [Oceanobacillus rekensis]